ncbi:MAG: hypothetical protein NT084_11850 [Bacteroidetes bacterium]|nr:hypothetical protein [Bacteroidota bacterium]
MITKPLIELHLEHEEWLNKLGFYADEIALMRKNLEDVVSKNTNKELLAKGEHFQNQLILQKENIDEIKHSIKDHENYLEHRIDEKPSTSDHRNYNDHAKMRDNFNGFEKNFNDLRREFKAFLSNAM